MTGVQNDFIDGIKILYFFSYIERQIYERLALVNAELWAVEDKLRLYEKRLYFGDEFISNAREVYKLNDLRSNLKRKINIQLGSNLTEEKSHF